jgi:hypothetical protein
MRLASNLLIAALLVLPSSMASAAGPRADGLTQESAEAAVAALGASADVERDLLHTQQDLYRRAAADRDGASRRLVQILADFDALILAPEPAPLDQIAANEKEFTDAERQRAAAIDRGKMILARISEIQQRLDGLEKKIASLRETLPKARETLSGTWQVTYLPGMTKGLFMLRQSGTIVQGQYQLDGGWKGSLQGTFVDGKIYLQRIDSKLGRSSELQGVLLLDGKQIRGTWQNYNLTDGGASAGSWTATRQED